MAGLPDAAPLLLVGCGKMGAALLRGWIRGGLAGSGVWVVEPDSAALGDLTQAGVRIFADADSLPASLAPKVVLLAVKPQTMDAVVPAYRRHAGQALFLSIAAGKAIAYLERHLGPAAIVRSMPNTPAAIGRGITVACANRKVTKAQADLAGALLSAVGAVEWVEDEALLDAVTAVSGGGPAYVFLLIECLAEAGAAAGLAPDLAMRLARATVAGSGELARQSDAPAAELRQAVTSPGGTTLEALKILMAPDGMAPLFVKAIAAATKRSRELADP